MFTQSVDTIIQKRVSTRTFSSEMIKPESLQELQNYFETAPAGPLGNRINLHLLPLNEGQKFGTYGFIKNPRGFISGSVAEKPGSYIDFGYCFEMMILKATDLGIATCWLGASFNRTKTAISLNIPENHIVPAATPIGYPDQKKSLLAKVIEFQMKPRNRKPFNTLFFNRNLNTPLVDESAGQYSTPLEMVRLAPSASNKQPWRIIKDGDQFHFMLKRNPLYGKMFKVDLQHLDIGIAMAHFESSAKSHNLTGEWINTDFTQPGLEYILTWQHNG